MGNETEQLESLWEKEEPAGKDSFAFEGEEIEFQEISAPAPVLPGGGGAPFEDLPAPAVEPAFIPPAPPEPFGPVGEAPVDAGPEHAPFEDVAAPAATGPAPFAPKPPEPARPLPVAPPAVTVATAQVTMPEESLPFEDFPAPPPPEPAAFESMHASDPAASAKFEDMAPAPILGPPSHEFDLEPAPLAMEKLEQQMKAARGIAPPPVRSVPPKAPPPSVAVPDERDVLVRDVEVPVVVSAVDLAGVTAIEFRIKLKVKIEP